MDDNFIIPPHHDPKKEQDLKTPIVNQVKGQAFNVSKGLALALVKPLFYRINVVRAAREAQAEELGGSASGGGLKPEFGFLGLPAYDTVTFDKFSYKDKDDRTVTLPSLTIKEVLIDIHRPKNIVETRIQGRDKDVNEYINGGNYYVMLKGKLVGYDANKPPTVLKKHCIALESAPVEVPVSSNYLSDFGIYSLIIREVTFKMVEGTRNVIEFEMDCKDEVPFEIKSNA